MSLHYILDGYNIIKSSTTATINKLKDQRLSLIRFIEHKRPQGSHNNKVTIVFDGGGDPVSFAASSSLNKRFELEIIFTHNESADDKIKKLVSSSKNPKRIVVVSNDREINFFIKSYGAHPMSVDEFMGKEKSLKEIRKESPKVELSYQQITKINEELKRIWLKES